MTEQRRFLDVWIVESNTVYREVPFTVVTDWVQQGRLLEEDKGRFSGTNQWFRIGSAPEFSPYLPKAEPQRPQDQAEALEAVQGDIVLKRHPQDEDEDVDMIPLIDVSLVLLIFFMLVSTGVGAAAFVPTPKTDNGQIVDNPESVAININLKADDVTPVFSLGADNRFAAEDSNLASIPETLSHLDEILKGKGTSQVVINAHKDLKAGIVRNLITELERKSRRAKIREIRIGVSEK